MTADSYLERIQAVPYGGAEDTEWTRRVLAIYLEAIEGRVHFAQAAYRDGEFPWMLGVSAPNANGEVYDPELGRQLRQTLLHPVGQWCVYFAPSNPFRPRADAWLAEQRPPVQWIPDRPFGRASEQGVLAPFFGALRKRTVCIVGPWHLEHLPVDLLGHRAHVKVPPHVAWKQAARLAERVIDMAATYDVFLIACGSAAALTIWRAWPHVKDRATLIDIGATLDPYAGVFSRNKTRNPRWQRDVLPRNVA